MAVLVGPQGPRGDRGPVGPVGPRGFDGKRGPSGKNGKDGERGLKGDRGDRGFAGTKGDQGIQGRQGKDGASGKDGSIAGIEHTLLPTDVATDSTPGSGLTAAARDHTHKGVRSIRQDAEPQLFGDVTIAAGTNISMVQVGNTITIASTGSGSPLTFTAGLVNTLGTVRNTFFTGDGSSQTLFGASGAGGDLHLSSTSHATKGSIFLGTGVEYDESADALSLTSLAAGGIVLADPTTGLLGLVAIGTGLDLTSGILSSTVTGGITALTGDAAAGPGSGSQALTFATVNADVGSFTNANFTVNAKGLVTAASNGSPLDHKVSIDGSDTTYDFLAAKLLATAPLTLNIAGGAPTPPLTNLLAWFKGDTGVTLSGSDVTVWADQSGNGYDLTPTGGDDKPTLATGVLNGLPGLLFDTTNGNAQLVNTSAVMANNGPFYVVAVVLPETPTVGPQAGGFVAGGPVLYPNTPTLNFYPTFGDYGGQTWVTGGNQSSAPTTIASGTPNLVEWGSTGYPGTFSCYQDGTDLSPFTGGTATAPDSGTGIIVGSDGGFTGNGSFSGYILELFIYSAAPSAPELAALRGYVQARYAFTVAGASGGSGSETLVAALTIDSTLAVVSSTLGRAAISGDGSIAAGLNTFALSNIPTHTTMAGDLRVTNTSVPATPGAGLTTCWVDSTAKNFACRNDAGIVNHGIQSNGGSANSWISAIADNGSVTLSQPAFSDISGTIAAAQLGSFTNGSVLFWDSGLAQDNANFSYSGSTLSLAGATPIALTASGTQNISRAGGDLGILTTGAFAINLATNSAVRFTVDSTGGIGLNGASIPTNASLSVGLATNADRDRVVLSVGGGALGATGTGDNTLLDVVPSGTNIRSGVTAGIYATQRIRSLTYTGVSSPTVTEAASLYIDGQPFVGAATATNGVYALHVAGGLTSLDGTLKLPGLTASQILVLDSFKSVTTRPIPPSASYKWSHNYASSSGFLNNSQTVVVPGDSGAVVTGAGSYTAVAGTAIPTTLAANYATSGGPTGYTAMRAYTSVSIQVLQLFLSMSVANGTDLTYGLYNYSTSTLLASWSTGPMNIATSNGATSGVITASVTISAGDVLMLAVYRTDTTSAVMGLLQFTAAVDLFE